MGSSSSIFPRSCNPDLVLNTIAGCLGLRDMGAESLHDRLSAAIADRRLLLVLDNFEQVVTAAPRVRSLLDACPEVTLLVTSRIRLRVSGEREFPVGPLPLDTPAMVEDAEDVRGGPALRRARAGYPARFQPERRDNADGCRDRSPGRRPPARDRAGRGAHQGPAPGGPPATPGTAAAAAQRRRPGSAAAAADHARHDRVELRPARRRRAGPVPPPRGLRRRVHARGGRSGRWVARSRSAADSRVHCRLSTSTPTPP